jgi:hypothetical protein
VRCLHSQSPEGGNLCHVFCHPGVDALLLFFGQQNVEALLVARGTQGWKPCCCVVLPQVLFSSTTGAVGSAGMRLNASAFHRPGSTTQKVATEWFFERWDGPCSYVASVIVWRHK